MKNAMWYLGFLSLMSLLYFVEHKTAFLWFIGFLPYFAIYRENDEMLERCVGKGARNAFLYTMGAGAGSLGYIYVTGSTELFAPAFILLMGGTLLVCILSIFYYNQKGG